MTFLLPALFAKEIQKEKAKECQARHAYESSDKYFFEIKIAFHKLIMFTTF